MDNHLTKTTFTSQEEKSFQQLIEVEVNHLMNYVEERIKELVGTNTIAKGQLGLAATTLHYVLYYATYAFEHKLLHQGATKEELDVIRDQIVHSFGGVNVEQPNIN